MEQSANRPATEKKQNKTKLQELSSGSLVFRYSKNKRHYNKLFITFRFHYLSGELGKKLEGN